MTLGLVTRVLARVSPPAVLLIDGRSGSGKTTLASNCARELECVTGSTPQSIGMDELYPGWEGLSEGSASLANVLRAGRYLRYDWENGEFGSEVVLDPRRMLIVEGCGSITAASIQAARGMGDVYRVWIECPEQLRRDRALTRDGDMFATHWERWAAQEQAHFSRQHPIAQANEIMHVV